MTSHLCEKFKSNISFMTIYYFFHASQSFRYTEDARCAVLARVRE